MTDVNSKQIVIWETSAVNKLAGLRDYDDLIERMEIAYTHWVPMNVFDEIAETQFSKKRDHLLRVCRRLMGSSSWSLKSPWALILEAIRTFSVTGKMDWDELLKAHPKFEEAVASGMVFDDDLAVVQRPQMQGHLDRIERFFAEGKTQLESIFRSGSSRPDTLDEFIERTGSAGLMPCEIRRICRCILGRDVDLQFVEKLSRAFPPINALYYAFLIAHYRRSGPSSKKNKRKSAGAFDLYASVYLPLCHKYVSDDSDQLTIFRDVVKYCPLRAEVIWFNGDFRSRFSN